MKIEIKNYEVVSKFGIYIIETFSLNGVKIRERVRITKKVKKVEPSNSTTD